MDEYIPRVSPELKVKLTEIKHLVPSANEKQLRLKFSQVAQELKSDLKSYFSKFEKLSTKRNPIKNLIRPNDSRVDWDEVCTVLKFKEG